MRIFPKTHSDAVLSGHVCTVHIVVSMNVELENDAWRRLADDWFRTRLHSELLAATHQSLGPEFDLREVSFRRGSIEVIVTIGAVYYAISRYKNFVESIELFVSQLSGVVSRLFESSMQLSSQGLLSASATWQPGPGLVRLEAGTSFRAGVDWAYPLLWYFILSHGALLTMFMWLLSRK